MQLYERLARLDHPHIHRQDKTRETTGVPPSTNKRALICKYI